MRESTIERYLKVCVRAAGGTTRKFVSPGHNGVPDQIVIWPRREITTFRLDGYVVVKAKTGIHLAACIHFVETKAPGGKPRPGQKREHDRLRALGCTVKVISTKEQVDAYVGNNR